MSDQWAVGYLGEVAPPITLHWDGAAWTQVPAATNTNGVLYRVGAVSPTDVWAVGYVDAINGRIRPLIEHWDGGTWSVSEAPSPPVYDYLNDVAVISASDIWAVGDYQTKGGRIHGLTEHWDGASWTLVQAPDATPYATVFYGVTALSSGDVWVVGYEQTQAGISSPIQPVSEHWDGTNWTVVSMPPPTGTSNYLNAVSAVSSDDVWAVGTFGDSSGLQSLSEHWDGVSWTQVIAPQVPVLYNSLSDVTALSTSDVWAVGKASSAVPSSPLSLHWDGTTWKLEATPNPYNGALLGSWALSSTDIWAVGAFGSPGGPLVEQSKGPC